MIYKVMDAFVFSGKDVHLLYEKMSIFLLPNQYKQRYLLHWWYPIARYGGTLYAATVGILTAVPAGRVNNTKNAVFCCRFCCSLVSDFAVFLLTGYELFCIFAL